MTVSKTLSENARRQYGEYDVESVLGRGAMGQVYLARHRRIGRRVALKTVQVERMTEEGEEFYLRLQREAEVSASLQHPNIVTLYEVVYENDVVSYLISEYVDGESLLDRLRRSKPLPLMEAVQIAIDVLRGLVHAHARGVVHRDIKPANILITLEGEAKIADFGIARPLHSSLTEAGALLGTPNYMSPEQVRSSAVTAQSDLFSLGVVLYEMVTGVKPFAGDDLSAILYNIVHRDPMQANEVITSVPAPLSAFVARMMAKSPDDRFPSAAAALQELQQLQRDIDLSSIPVLASETGTLDLPPPASLATDPLLDPTVVTSPGLTRRPVPGTLFVVVAFGLGGALVGTLVQIRSRFETPRSLITPTQQVEFEAKRIGLEEARQLFSSGQYDQSLEKYNAYLEKYPESLAARQERDDVERARAETRARKRSKPARSSTATDADDEEKKEEPPKRPSFRDRLRRIFRGK